MIEDFYKKVAEVESYCADLERKIVDLERKIVDLERKIVDLKTPKKTTNLETFCW